MKYIVIGKATGTAAHTFEAVDDTAAIAYMTTN
jgi:hypothetical protein